MWTSPYEVVDFFSPKKCLLMEVWGGKGGGGGGGEERAPGSSYTDSTDEMSPEY